MKKKSKTKEEKFKEIIKSLDDFEPQLQPFTQGVHIYEEKGLFRKKVREETKEFHYIPSEEKCPKCNKKVYLIQEEGAYYCRKCLFKFKKR